MKRVINITIGQIVFSIEEDAYEKLSKYLDSIRQHFVKDKDKNEILEDIEVSIAEKFLKIRKNKNLAISITNVETIIEQMGTIKDFDKEDSEDDKEEDEKSSSIKDKIKERIGAKKLYRDPGDVIIAGVASGLAAYFGIETVLIRLAFFITIFFGGAGFVIYIILWIIMPVAETSEQKFEMRGEKVTLKQIEKTVKEEVKKFKKKDFSFLNKFFKSLAKIVFVFARFITWIVGISLAIAGIAGICAISLAISWAIAGFGIASTTIAISDFVILQGTFYWLFVGSLYFIVLIPILLILLLGISIARLKNSITTVSLVSFLVIWFVSLGFAGSMIIQNQENITKKIWEVRDTVIKMDKECDSWTFWGKLECTKKKSDDKSTGTIGATCKTATDCKLPMEYAIRSECPYQAYCQDGRCIVACPLSQY